MKVACLALKLVGHSVVEKVVHLDPSMVDWLVSKRVELLASQKAVGRVLWLVEHLVS